MNETPCRLSRNLAAPEYLCLVDVTNFCTDGDGVIAHVGSYVNNGRFHTAETLHCTVKSSWSILPFLDTTLAIPSAEVGAEADDLENVHAQT
jgi:hypothetical protein